MANAKTDRKTFLAGLGALAAAALLSLRNRQAPVEEPKVASVTETLPLQARKVPQAIARREHVA